MKRCMRCNGLFEALSFECAHCHFIPQTIDGFLALAPEMSLRNDHYNPEIYQSIIDLEAKSFWFNYRNKLIIASIKKYCTHFNNLLEIGCGTGFVLAELCRHFPDKDFYGSDIYLNGLNYAAKRSKSSLLQFDCHQIPFVNEFDIIGAFDVLEHLEEDVLVLNQINQALTENGYLIVTVPQHPFLWSETDNLAHHVRRYTAKELVTKFTQAGFKILYKTSFLSFLMPVLLLFRLLNKKPSSVHKLLPELQLPAFLNNFFYSTCLLENQLIKLGVHFPYGGSLLIVGQKDNP